MFQYLKRKPRSEVLGARSWSGKPGRRLGGNPQQPNHPGLRPPLLKKRSGALESAIFILKIFAVMGRNLTFAVRFQICFHFDENGRSLKPCFACACEGAVYGGVSEGKNMV